MDGLIEFREERPHCSIIDHTYALEVVERGRKQIRS